MDFGSGRAGESPHRHSRSWILLEYYLYPYYDDDLTVARLNVLERRERHEEYLRLADYADQVARHAVMLIRLGRLEEAVEYGLKRLTGSLLK